MISRNLIWTFKGLRPRLRKLFFLTVFINLAVVIVELATITTLITFLGMLSGSTSISTGVLADFIFRIFALFTSDHSSYQLYVAYLFFVLIIIKCGAALIQNHLLVSLTHGAYDQVVWDLLRSYSQLPYYRYLLSSPSIMQKTIISDAYNYSHVIAAIISMASEGLLFFVLIFYLTVVTPLYSLVALSLLLVCVYFLNRYVGIKVSSLGEKRERRMAQIYRGTADTFRNHKYLMSNNMFSYNLQKLYHNIQEWSKDGKSYGTLSIIPRISVEGVAYISIVVLFLLGTNLNANDQQDFFSLLSAFAVIMARLLPSTNRIISQLNLIKFNSRAISIIREVIDESNTSTPNEISNADSSGKGAFLLIRMRNLEILRPSGQMLFKVESLDIRRGNKVVIIGPSGSGKSTFLDVLMGLQPSPNGTLSIECQSTNGTPEYLTSLIGLAHYIPQRIHLFHGTLYENIALSDRPDIPRCKTIISQLGLIDLLQTHGSSDFSMGEDATNLSGGQAQRIGIARAIYSKSEILIFDEPTTALDAESTMLFVKLIETILFDRTVIIVTHDSLVATNFDSVFSVDNGRLHEI